MIPILYDENEMTFESEGMGLLPDAVSVSVKRVLNGVDELTMSYPISGFLYDELKPLRQILVVPEYKKSVQAYRIYRVSKPMQGLVTVNARHISERRNYTTVKPFSAGTAVEMFAKLPLNIVDENSPFTFYTDKAVTAPYNMQVPASLGAVLGGVEGSALDVYGGEYEFDMYQVKLLTRRGVNSGVTVTYGKNLTQLELVEMVDETVITSICPVWVGSEEGDIVYLPEFIIDSTYVSSYPFRRAVVIDFSADIEARPTVAELRAAANSYMTSHSIGVRPFSLKVSFVHLAQFEDYKDYALLETLNLGDMVTVKHADLGVDIFARITETNFDVLNERYNSVIVGRVQSNISTKLEAIEKTVDRKVKENRNIISEAVDHATDLITGVDGGYVVMNMDASGHPYEILIMDTDDKATATNVIRMNQNGIGFSRTGYNGPFLTAWTIDGSFVANFITAGEMSANRVRTGLLQDVGGTNYWNLDTGEVHLDALDLIVEKVENIGARNYLAWSNDTTKWVHYTPTAYRVARINLTTALEEGEKYTVTIWGDTPTRSDKEDCYYSVFYAGGTTRLGDIEIGADGRGSVTFTAPAYNAENNFINIYNTPTAGKSGTIYGASLLALKLERGEIATDWTPAPEDDVDRVTEAKAEIKVTTDAIEQSVTQERQRATGAESALSTQITQTASSIRSEVSETYETKADAAVVNMLPSVYFREYVSGREWTNNGITWVVNNDGSVTATGTATDTSTFPLTGAGATSVVPWIAIDPDTTYTYSHGTTGGAWQTSYSMQVRTMDASGTQLSNTSIADGGTSIKRTNQAYIFARLIIASGYACPSDGITFYPQMEKGSTAHGYVSTHGGSYAMQSSIEQNATNIALKVSQTDYNGNTIASLINQTATTIKLDASKIDLQGYVTFTNLSTAGQTIIDGGNITTGTLNANLIKAGVLSDVAGKNSWNLTTGAFTITDGSLNITTALSEEESIIKLRYQTQLAQWENIISPKRIEITADLLSASYSADGIVLTSNGSNSKVPFRLSRKSASIGGVTYDSAEIILNKETRTSSGRQTMISLDGMLGHILAKGAITSGTSISAGSSDGAGNYSGYDTSGTRRVYLDAGSGSINITNGTQALSYTAGSIFQITNGANKYSALIWPDNNGAGRFVLGNGTNTLWRTELTNSGLVFRNDSDAVTARYLATPTREQYTVAETSGTLTFSGSNNLTVCKTGSNGYIQLNALLTNGADFATGTYYTLYTLPAGSRPLYDVTVHISNQTGTSACFFNVTTAGLVRIYRYSGSAAWAASSWIRAVVPVIFAVN